MKYRKGQVYARRIHQKDRADSIVTRFRMAYYSLKGTGYVIVRHGGRGLSNTVLEVFGSKRDCQKAFVGGWKHANKFFGLYNKKGGKA